MMNRAWQLWLHRLMWVGLLVLAVTVPVTHFGGYAWNYDEGVLLQTAVLANRGYPLYAETVFNKPPLIIWWLQLAFTVGGQSTAVANVSMLLLTTAGLVLLGVLARLWWGRWADVAAMAIYLLIPESLVRSAVVMNDLPAMAAMLAALVAATLFRQHRHWAWVVVTAVSFAVGLGLHPLLVIMALPVGLVLLFPATTTDLQKKNSADFSHTLPRYFASIRASIRNHSWDWSHIFKTGLIFGGGVLVVTAGWLMLVAWAGFWKWVVAFNDAPLGAVLQERATRNGVFLLDAHLHHWPLLITVLLGLPLLWQNRKARGWVGLSLLWYLVTLISLERLQPMWEHYIFLAYYPLILLAAGGIGAALRRRQPEEGMRHPQWLARLTLVWTVVAIGLGAAAEREWPVWQAHHLEARQFVLETFPQNSFVISNSPYLLFTTGHVVPPTLTDTSNKRISTGLLTPTDVLNAQARYDAAFLLFDDKHFGKLPMLYQWAENEAEQLAVFAQIEAYRMVERPSPVQTSLDVAFQPGIRLRGVTMHPVETAVSGTVVSGTLYWEGVETIPEAYQIFVHLVNENGNLVGQQDGPPADGRLPTTIWHPGILVPDAFQIVLPPESAGAYQLMVGMYTLPDVQRLPAFLDGERVINDVVPVTAVFLP